MAGLHLVHSWCLCCGSGLRVEFLRRSLSLASAPLCLLRSGSPLRLEYVYSWCCSVSSVHNNEPEDVIMEVASDDDNNNNNTTAGPLRGHKHERTQSSSSSRGQHHQPSTSSSPTPSSPKRLKMATPHSSKPKASDYEGHVKRLLLKVMFVYETYIYTVYAYPAQEYQAQWVRKAWNYAGENEAEKYDLTCNMEHLVWFLFIYLFMSPQLKNILLGQRPWCTCPRISQGHNQATHQEGIQ